VRLKWHTLAVAGSLGIFASFHPLLADDAPAGIQQSPLAGDPPSILSQISPRAAARRIVANPTAQDKIDGQGLSQELLRQAMVELDAKRFDTARRLARRAAALGVSAGSIQPEQLLQEIDRRERGAKVVVQQAPPAAADPRTQLKSRAIELLDRGILALDQKHFDYAENCAQMAAQIHVMWDRYDYKPENLLEDIHRERSAGPASPVRPIADLAYDARPAAPATIPQPTEWSQRANPSSPVTAAVAVPAQPAPTAATSGGRTTAQAVLEQAMDDLRAGRDELARLRIEQALNSIQASPQSSPVASFAGYSAAANRPVGLTPGGLVPTAPGYTPSTAAATFFPVRRDQPNVAPIAPSASDVALKPMHDPFLGDDATTTDKLSAGAQTMRESMPTGATINPVYVSRSSLPVMTDTPVQRVGYNTPVPGAVPVTPRAPLPAELQSSNPQINWLEKMSAPIPPQGAMPPPQAYAGQQTAPQQYVGQPYPPVPQQRGFNAAPIAQPVAGDTQWQPGRMATPSGTDPTAGNSPDQPKPGFFQKVWGAISGE
jgi:hypothetical protein